MNLVKLALERSEPLPAFVQKRVIQPCGKAQKLEGEIPSPTNPPPGCKFQTRCPMAIDRCRVEEPVLETAGPEHNVACHRWKELVN